MGTRCIYAEVLQSYHFNSTSVAGNVSQWISQLVLRIPTCPISTHPEDQKIVDLNWNNQGVAFHQRKNIQESKEFFTLCNLIRWNLALDDFREDGHAAEISGFKVSDQ
jgi:hypothetical protein